MALSTAFGTISFFIFCAFRFGSWNQYFRARAFGWGVEKTDPLLQLEYLRVFVPRFADGLMSPVDVSQLHGGFLIFSLLLIPAADFWLTPRGRLTRVEQRLPLYVRGGCCSFWEQQARGSRRARIRA